MLWTNLKRVMRAGFTNFWRNGTVSLASVFMMVVTLLVIGFMLFSSAVLNSSLDALKQKVDITVTFIPSAAEADIKSVEQSLEKLPEVSLVTYTSRDEVLQAFVERHKNDQSILTALDELNDNPLGASLDIKAKDPSQYQSIADFLSGSGALSTGDTTIIDHINYYQNKVAIDKLSGLIRSANKLGLAIALAFILLSILIAYNTIRLTIYIVREEVSVMRLVGASSMYVQGPFVTLGIVYGIFATLLTSLIFLPVTYWIGQTTQNFFIDFNLFTYYLHNSVQIFLILLASGIVIGAVSSFLAIRKYLKV